MIPVLTVVNVEPSGYGGFRSGNMLSFSNNQIKADVGLTRF